jgi:hypothetical protein
MPESAIETRSNGMSKANVYRPYLDGPRRRAIAIEPIAKIAVADAFPTNRNRPPRVAFSAIPVSPSEDIALNS